MEKKEVDMYYRFTWDTEPTDEQLDMIIEGAKQEVLKQNEKIKEILFKNLNEEFLKTKKIIDELFQWKDQNC